MSGAGDGWERLFARAVRLYPARFRERWGREMRSLFRAELQRVRRAGGRWSAGVYATRGLAAAVSGAGWEWARLALGGTRPGVDDGYVRRGREGMMIDEVRQDVTVLARSLRRRPGFAVVVIATLAMGIGVTTGVFSVVQGVLLRPLPYDDPHELVHFAGGGASSLPNAADLSERLEAVGPVAGFFVPGSETLTGAGDPIELSRSYVAGDFFPMLGVGAATGRLLGPGDEGTARVVLAHGLWQRRFGADPSVLGRTLTLSEEPMEVVGVAPPSVGEPFAVDVYVPYPWAEGEGPRGSRGWRAVEVYGRIADGRTLEEARAELAAEWARLQADYPDVNGRWRVGLVGLREHLTGDEGPALGILFWASLLFLLIACANVAALFLGRLEARSREFAVRSALGAGRARLVRQAWVEALAVGIVGGGVGVGLAAVFLDRSLAAFGTSLSRMDEVALDGTVLLFSLAATLLTAAVMGLVTVLSWRTEAPAGALREGGRGGGGRTGWLRRSLVVGEVAMALVVVTALALLTRSFLEVQSVDVGLDPDGVVALQLGSYPDSRYPDRRSGLAFVQRLRERVEATPGMEAAALASRLPLGGCCNNGAWQRVDDPERENRFVELRVVTPGYFEVLGIPLLAGRVLEGTDREGEPPAVVVNETLARQLWDGAANPVGGAIRPSGSDADLEVVGVVGSVREYSPEREPPPIVYLPVAQNPSGLNTLLVRSGLPAEQVAGELRTLLRELDPLLPVESVRPLGDVLAGMTADRRATTALMSLMGLLAFVLGGIGVYGVVSHSVTTRLGEIGIRLALGAPRRSVLRKVVGGSLLLVLPGVVLGAAGAAAAHGVVESLLFGVEPFDPWVWTSVVAVFLAVAVLAAWGPARRAASVDPVETLKEIG